MQPGPYEKIPLTADEKSMLLDLYDSRRRFLFVVYIILFVVALGCSQRIDSRSRYSWQIHHWEENNPDTQFISRFGMRIVSFCFLETVVLGSGVFFFVTRAYRLKKDADSGMKEKVPYKILQKQYYSVSEQYFFDIDNPALLHHEVDKDTYNKLNEGDYFYIYRGEKSKFIFEESGKYTIL
jgi:hypothetical protein